MSIEHVLWNKVQLVRRSLSSRSIFQPVPLAEPIKLWSSRRICSHLPQTVYTVHCTMTLLLCTKLSVNLTFGSTFKGVVCLMKDLITAVRPRVFGVIISIWFFCTVWRKDRMLGLIACGVIKKKHNELIIIQCYYYHYLTITICKIFATHLHFDFSWEERTSSMDFPLQYLVLCVWYSLVI